MASVNTTEVGQANDVILELSGVDRVPALRPDQWNRTVYEMTTQDATVGAVLFAVEMAIRAVAWSSIPKDDSDEAKLWAQRLTEAFDDMPDSWADIVADAFTFAPYGYSLFELVYKVRNGYSDDRTVTSNYDDGLVGWRKWAFRPQSSKVRWEMKNGEVVGWTQRKADYTEVTIPVEQLVIFRSSSRQGQPEGVSILKRAYRAYYHKRETEIQESIGIGRDLAGLIHIEVPANVLVGTQPAEIKARNMYTKMAKHISRGIQEGIITESTTDAKGNKAVNVSLLNSGGQRQFDTTRIIERWRTDIAMTMLADFMLVGHQSQGALSLSESKVDTFTRAISGWLDMMQESINEQAVIRLMRANGCPLDKMPKWTHGSVSAIDLEHMGDFLQKMVTTGILPATKKLAVWVAQSIGTPIPTDEELDEAFPEGSLAPPDPNAVPPVPGADPSLEQDPSKEGDPAVKDGPAVKKDDAPAKDGGA